ncbi:MAG: helicase C-terminal domain-containing protein [Verrucomicrobiota bacterium]|nr:helicase C-terminal domain-containing protein [Verrucomicrobiota bacterium]
MVISFIDEDQDSGSDLVADTKLIFSDTGLLSKAKNFEFRAEQQQMAVEVAKALEESRHLIIEAGTGVGKSLAYLIPGILYAVSHNKKAVISTHTINLQEQLTEKDLPMLKQILPLDFSFAMLKGRSNYLCTRRLQRARQQSANLLTSSEIEELKRITDWSRETIDGSLSDFEIMPDPKVWDLVCSERGLCSSKLCGHNSDLSKMGQTCFYQRARGRILAADLLVLNHSLFFSLLGEEEGDENNDGVLFNNDFVILDEAHNVSHVASKHIGMSVSSGQVRFNLQRLWNPKTGKGLLGLLRSGRATRLVEDAEGAMEHFFDELEVACDEINESQCSNNFNSGKRAAWKELRVRCAGLIDDSLTLPLQRVREVLSQVREETDDADTVQELAEFNRRIGELREAVLMFLSQASNDHVYWVEKSGKSNTILSLNAAPIDVAVHLRRRLFKCSSPIILTSATLALSDLHSSKLGSMTRNKLDNPLDYFAGQIGAEVVEAVQVGSPFNYEKQMKLFIAGKMPDPRDPEFRDALVTQVRHFVGLTDGGAFVLFTNFKLMRDIAEELEGFFLEQGIECMMQGAGVPRSIMLERFKRDERSVLFGTDSFWQGVDVPGDALRNVIITRLPFMVPDHPLVEAQIEAIEARAGNAFMEFSLPVAVLKFRQGVGRLIRTKSDNGIVVVLDNRVLTKRYGEIFLHSLPSCPKEVV